MPKRYSSSDTEKVAGRLGFTQRKKKGNDATWSRTGSLPVSIPMNKSEIAVGTFRAIVRQMGIDTEEFERILENKGGDKA